MWFPRGMRDYSGSYRSNCHYNNNAFCVKTTRHFLQCNVFIIVTYIVSVYMHVQVHAYYVLNDDVYSGCNLLADVIE